MQRKAWFEIHDHRLFPDFLRDLVTDALQAMWNARDIYGPIAPRLERALAESGTRRVVDLCSGGGGPWIGLSRRLSECGSETPEILLTDKYPNKEAFRQIRDATGSAICFRFEPVNAMRIPAELSGFRTMFSTFHHFGPAEARAILSDAFAQRQGIAVFEAAKRDLRALATMCLVPLLALQLGVGIRPFRWARIFWTYVVPVIPFTLWLDGVLSCLRTYSQADLKELISGLESADYRWETGEESRGLVTITYLMGCPVQRHEAGEEDLDMAEIETPAR